MMKVIAMPAMTLMKRSAADAVQKALTDGSLLSDLDDAKRGRDGFIPSPRKRYCSFFSSSR